MANFMAKIFEGERVAGRIGDRTSPMYSDWEGTVHRAKVRFEEAARANERVPVLFSAWKADSAQFHVEARPHETGQERRNVLSEVLIAAMLSGTTELIMTFDADVKTFSGRSFEGLVSVRVNDNHGEILIHAYERIGEMLKWRDLNPTEEDVTIGSLGIETYMDDMEHAMADHPEPAQRLSQYALTALRRRGNVVEEGEDDIGKALQTILRIT